MSKWSSSNPGPYPRTGYPGPIGVEGQYSPDVIYKNPTSAVPGPLATENRGYWSGEQTTLAWAQEGDTPTIAGDQPNFVATWSSPVFDLRPDLRASSSVENQSAYPIFRGGAFGAGATLQVQIHDTPIGNTSFITNLQDLELFSQEFAHVVYPRNRRILASGNPSVQIPLPGITPPPQPRGGGSSAMILTSEFYQGSGATVMSFIPPANPIRYWALILYFMWHPDSGGGGRPPNLLVQGVCE